MSTKDGKSVLIEGKPKKGIYHAQVSDDELFDNKIAATNCPVNIIRINPK
jgi:ferredoxin